MQKKQSVTKRPTGQWTDEPTDGRTDTTSYGDATAHLKRDKKNSCPESNDFLWLMVRGELVNFAVSKKAWYAEKSVKLLEKWL